MPIPSPTEEEVRLIKEYILYPVIMDTIEKDIGKMKETKFKMTDVYVRSLRKVQIKATEEHSKVRQDLKKRGIKVYEEVRGKEYLESKYLCRSYHGNLNLLWVNVKVEVEIRLYKYMGIDPKDDTLTP